MHGQDTSAAVGEMFKGFGGYVQADAKSVYDILFRPPDGDGAKAAATQNRRTEVGCWVHGRRGLWEAAITTKSEVAREGLFRIHRIYALEKTWRGKPPDSSAPWRLAGSGRFFEWQPGGKAHKGNMSLVSRARSRRRALPMMPRIVSVSSGDGLSSNLP